MRRRQLRLGTYPAQESGTGRPSSRPAGSSITTPTSSARARGRSCRSRMRSVMSTRSATTPSISWASTSGRPAKSFLPAATFGPRSRSVPSWRRTTGSRFAAGRRHRRSISRRAAATRRSSATGASFRCPSFFVTTRFAARQHGERKVFQERRNRFLDGERERGWHVQYDGLGEGASFVKDPSTLSPVRWRRRPRRPAAPRRGNTRASPRRRPPPDRGAGDRDCQARWRSRATGCRTRAQGRRDRTTRCSNSPA